MTSGLTVLQTLDSERYKPEEAANWAIDLAHARSEVVTTLLAGGRILLTANDVGDSPAAQRLLSEFMAAGESDISAFNSKREPLDRFVPFVIGLENQYRERAGQRGYAAYVAKQRDAAIARIEACEPASNFKAIGKTAEETGLSQDEVLRGMASTYLGIEETEVGRLKAAKPGIWAYAGMVRRCFHEDVIGYDAAHYCPGNPFTDGTSLQFGRSLETLAKIAGERSGDADRAEAIRSQVVARRGSQGALPARADWNAILDAFGPNSEIVRDWVDFILFDRVFMAFSSDDQVFFTQQCAPDVEENRFRMAVLSDGAFQTFEKTEAANGRLRPSIASAPWRWLIPLLLSDRFRSSIGVMRNELRDVDRFEQVTDRQKARRDAMQGHVGRLVGMTSEVTAVQREGALIDLQVAPQPLATAWQDVAKSTGGSAVTMLVSTMAGANPPAAIALGLAAAVGLAGVGIVGAVEKLRRPRQRPGSPLAANLVAEPDHINWRVTRI